MTAVDETGRQRSVEGLEGTVSAVRMFGYFDGFFACSAFTSGRP